MMQNRIVVTIMKWIGVTMVIAVFLYCLFTSAAVSALFWLAVSVFALLGYLAISVQIKIDEKETREF